MLDLCFVCVVLANPVTYIANGPIRVTISDDEQSTSHTASALNDYELHLIETGEKRVMVEMVNGSRLPMKAVTTINACRVCHYHAGYVPEANMTILRMAVNR